MDAMTNLLVYQFYKKFEFSSPVWESGTAAEAGGTLILVALTPHRLT